MPSIKSLALLALLSLTTLVLASSDDPNTVAVLADQFPLQVPNEDAVIASKDFVDDTALDLTEDDDGEVEEMAQHHKVVITNKCGKGKGVFLYAKGKVYATVNANPQGSTTIHGPLNGGVAWVQGFDNCESSGVNCGIVEFTLTNPGTAGKQNAADYSLLDGPGLGNHKYKYKMDFKFTHTCKKSPGACTGDSKAKCPGAYLGSDTTGGAPTQCVAKNAGENGGTILAISSPGFAIVASDTRQSEGYSIQTRYARKCHQLTPEVVMAVQGFQADGTALVKRVKQRLEWYYHTHQSTPSLPSIARMIQTMLYGKRFFPYYAYVILGGIDKDGTGAVYSFDPVGSYERESCRAAGAAQSLVQPFLDNMVYSKNQTQDPSKPPLAKGERPDLPLDTVLALVTDAFTGATERHIEVGDGLEMFVIKKGQPIEIISKELKRD